MPASTMLLPRRGLVLAASLVAALTISSPATIAQSVLFRGVRVFDGTRATAGQDVLVEHGRIAKIGRALAAPAGVAVVDGTGKTLLPGLIDAHTHVRPRSLESAIGFGVTTELDMFTDVALAKQIRAEQTAGKATARADIRTTGTLVTAPGGHGTEYGLAIPTIGSAAEAQGFVDARIADGSDYIKIVYDGGHTYGMRIPTIGREMLRAVVAGARDAIDAGADGLAHLFVDTMPDAGFASLVARHRAFVIPTLSVLASITNSATGAKLPTTPASRRTSRAATMGCSGASSLAAPAHQPPASRPPWRRFAR